jgi:hypothetical protein
VILTAVGYLLLLLFGLAVGLFCWLSYSSLRGAARPIESPAPDNLLDPDSLLEEAARDITGQSVSAG